MSGVNAILNTNPIRCLGFAVCLCASHAHAQNPSDPNYLDTKLNEARSDWQRDH